MRAASPIALLEPVAAMRVCALFGLASVSDVDSALACIPESDTGLRLFLASGAIRTGLDQAPWISVALSTIVSEEPDVFTLSFAMHLLESCFLSFPSSPFSF
jgi:hypothetical protein